MTILVVATSDLHDLKGPNLAWKTRTSRNMRLDTTQYFFIMTTLGLMLHDRLQTIWKRVRKHYSSYLDPSDYHFFRPMRNALTGREYIKLALVILSRRSRCSFLRSNSQISRNCKNCIASDWQNLEKSCCICFSEK